MSDTIAAIATGGVIAAIGIIRLSGDDAISIADKVFRAAGGIRLTQAQDRRLYYGELFGKESQLLDLCMCTVSRGPGSYTGEDTVEFHCHGSPIVLAEALCVLFSHGARQALAGEFTKRAFLNGRLDLSQAEAVIDLIEAESPAAAKNAAGQLCGAVGTKLDPIYSTLLDILAHFQVVVDYPDEDINDFVLHDYLSVLQNIYTELSRLLETHARGKVLREGIPTAIIGKPNTGKSSLLNALLGYDRAIVTAIPGTTRDTIEEKLLVGDILLRVIDTAGIRNTDDVVESLGVSRTHDAVSRSSLVLQVFDGSEPLCDDDLNALHLVPAEIPLIAVINKSDLPLMLSTDKLKELGVEYCQVCALTGEGLDLLESEIIKKFPESSTAPTGDIITNARQAEAIARARDAVSRAVTALEASVTPDAVLTDIEDTLAAIGEITGKQMREDLISRIFERFCVGK